MDSSTAVCSLRLSSEMEARLREAAWRRRMSLSALMRSLLRAGLDAVDDPAAPPLSELHLAELRTSLDSANRALAALRREMR